MLSCQPRRSVAYKITYRQRGVHIQLLRQIADQLPHFVPLLLRIKPAYGNMAGCGFGNCCHQFHQSCFSGTVMSQQAKHAGLHRKCNIVKGVNHIWLFPISITTLLSVLLCRSFPRPLGGTKPPPSSQSRGYAARRCIYHYSSLAWRIQGGSSE